MMNLHLPQREERRLQRWAVLSLLNLFIVSFLGTTLRYKGAFSLPWINYKYLLNSHSHFAFSGWATTALFTGMVFILWRSGIQIAKTYRYLFLLNQVSSYGMLASFIWQGYGPASIFFSALSVVFSYWFAVKYWLDSRRAAWPGSVKVALRLALTFLVLSSAGPFLLAYSMSRALGNMAFYYNAIYLYLHFQYNGWFSLGVIGLFLWAAQVNGWLPAQYGSMWFVRLMGIACIPAYCLSLLWTEPPAWIWVLAATAASVQVIALFIPLRQAWKGRKNLDLLPQPVRTLWILSLLAFGIKILLQALSAIPSIGRAVYGFRAVIIAYLHLVLLGFVSLFLIGFFLSVGWLRTDSRALRAGVSVFIAGVIANEGVLMVQSLMAFMGLSWETCPYYLLAAALILFAGGGLLLTEARVNQRMRLK